VIVIAHRGASAYAPEHTTAAYDLAVTLRADYLEQDLQMTADGVLVVLHDDTLDRTVRCARRPHAGTRVRDVAWPDLRGCDAGSWFNDRFPDRARPEFADLKLPTLDQVLERYAGMANFYIETKSPEDAPGMEDLLVESLRRHGLLATHRVPATRAPVAWNPPPRVVVQSFSAASLRLVRKIAPGIPLVQLLEEPTLRSDVDALLDSIAEYADGIGPDHRAVDRRLVAAAHERGLVAHPYTINDPARMAALADVDVDGMFTDTPDLLAALPGRQGGRRT
jgi:glycerophosphoryl diester phosphodiesterase